MKDSEQEIDTERENERERVKNAQISLFTQTRQSALGDDTS